MGKAVNKIAPIAMGAAVGFATGGFVGMAIGAAAALASSMANNQKLPTGASQSEPSAQTVRSSKAPARFILGRASTGGILAFAQEEPGEQDNGEWLHLIYVLSDGEITGVDQVLLNKQDISEFGDNAQYEVHINRTSPDPFMLQKCPGWKNTQIGRGISYVRVSLKYDHDRFSSGIPEAQFIVRGLAVFDPRSDKDVYTDNAALHLLWYLRNRCGVPDDEIIMPSFINSANICDEYVNHAGGESSKRYACGGVIGANEPRSKVIGKLEDTCAGNLISVGGKFMLQVGAYYGPGDFTITEDMVIGEVTGSTETSNADAVNVINGTFIDPKQSWTSTDYPEVRMAKWVEEDGGESSDSLSLDYVSDVYQAQRLASIKLRKHRAGGSLKLKLNFNGYNCRPGRVVNVRLPSLNIVGEFVVHDWDMSGTDGVSIIVGQSDAKIYDDAIGTPYTPGGFISLPTGGMASPTNLAWAVKPIGEVVQGVLSWRGVGTAQSYNVVVRDAAGKAVYSVQVPGQSTQCMLNGLEAGAYAVGVSARGPLATSGETTISISINLPPVPDEVRSTAGNREVTLAPILRQGSLNGGTYQYWFTQSAEAPQTSATYLGQGWSFTHTGLSANTTYYYFVRSINAYGVSGFLRASVTTSNNFDEEMAAVERDIKRPGGLYDQIIDGSKGQIGKAVNVAIGDAVPEAVKSAVDPIRDQMRKNDEAFQQYQNTAHSEQMQQNLQIALNQAAVEGAHAAVEKESMSRATADGALSAQITRVHSELDGAVSDVTKSLDTSVQRLESGMTQAAAQANTDMRAAVAAAQSEFNERIKVQADDQLAQNLQITLNNASLAAAKAAIATESISRATADGAMSSQIVSVRASMNDLYAEVTQVMRAEVDAVKGTVSTLWSVKTETSNGKTAAVGLQNNGKTSEFGVLADRFYVMSEIGGDWRSVFTIDGGRTFINSAMIKDASIDAAKFTDYVRSSNWSWQSDSNFNGVEINMRTGKLYAQNAVIKGAIEATSFKAASGTSGMRTEVTERGTKVYDSAGRLRVELGVFD